MKKLIRCSVTEESSLDFYLFVDEKMVKSEIERRLHEFFSLLPIQDYDEVDTELRVDAGDVALDPDYLKLNKTNRAAFYIDDEEEIIGDAHEFGLKRLVDEMIEEREERKRVEAFEKDQLALKESGL